MVTNILKNGTVAKDISQFTVPASILMSVVGIADEVIQQKERQAHEEQNLIHNQRSNVS